MVTFVYGRTGTGKTYHITEEIEALLIRGERVILICPEQEAVVAEARMTDRFAGRVPTVGLEILNFGRLPERIGRVYGGLTQRDLSEGGRRLLMHRTLAECLPLLKEYGTAVSDKSMIDRLLSAVSDFKMGCITPSDLEAASDALARGGTGGSAFGGHTLRDKLSDLTLLYSVYERLLHTAYRDPEDRLIALEALLSGEGKAFFAGCHVYFDGFNGFTARQLRVIHRIVEGAADVTFTVGCETEGERIWAFRKLYEMEEALYRIVRDTKSPVRRVELKENKRTASSALRHITANLWRIGKTDPIPSGGDVEIVACTTPFEEAEYVACRIRRYVLAGGRYRDITVISREIDRYRGILDTVFETYEIPCYLSDRTDVAKKPFFRYLRSLLSLYIYRWQRQDLMTLLKTGLCGIDEEASFLYENYIHTWNLTGSRLSTEEEYTMHPGGYREGVTEEDLRVLSVVNGVREQILSHVSDLFDTLQAGGASLTVRAISEALYTHLIRGGIPRLLDDHALWEREHGDPEGGAETEQLWSVFVSLLDSMVDVSGDVICTVEGYLALFELASADIDIGTIPARCDEVVIGDAGLLRPDKPKQVFLIGAVDGLFPKVPTEDALFSDYEKSILETYGVSLPSDTARQTRDELFFFYYAAASPEEHLTVTYPTRDLSGKAFRPSIGVERIGALFSDDCTVSSGDESPYARILTPETAFESMVVEGDSPMGRALLDFYRAASESDAHIKGWLTALSTPVTKRHNRLTAETAALLFRRDLYMTQSRLDAYVMCHFAYFCGYVLRLKEQKTAVVGPADIGSFVHYVLEGFMQVYRDAPDRDACREEGFIRETVTALLEGYLSDHIKWDQAGAGSERIRHLFRRLTETSVLVVKNLVDEFAQSDFVPRDIELPVGGDDGTAMPALTISAPDGTTVRLSGYVDRVDTYEKDGVTYVRVVDYKTGTRTFSLSDVAAGINMQMLLYLFAIWKNGGTRYGGEIVPAGVLYMGTTPKDYPHEKIPSKETVEDKAEEGLKRSGLFLDDRALLSAMDHGLTGKYIPVKVNKDGSYRKGASLASLEDFGHLMHEVEDTVCRITGEMRAGNADAIPIHKTNPSCGKNPCEYCQMKPVCRAMS